MSLNGMTVLGQYQNTLYVRLPENVSRPINGGCSCDYCKARPDVEPRWDTLCVPFGQNEHIYTWTVHMPIAADFLQ